MHKQMKKKKKESLFKIGNNCREGNKKQDWLSYFLIWVPNRYSTASTQQLEMVEKIPFFYGCSFGPFVVTSLLESRRRIENNEITTKIDWFIHYFEKNLA